MSPIPEKYLLLITFYTYLGSTIWTPHKVELAVWTHYVVHDLKPELLINLPSAKNSITAVSTSDSADHQTTDGERTEPEDINFNPAATKSSVEALSELSSSAALSLPPENTESAVEDVFEEPITSTSSTASSAQSSKNNSLKRNKISVRDLSHQFDRQIEEQTQSKQNFPNYH